jgi:hypothetical protein
MIDTIFGEEDLETTSVKRRSYDDDDDED